MSVSLDCYRAFEDHGTWYIFWKLTKNFLKVYFFRALFPQNVFVKIRPVCAIRIWLCSFIYKWEKNYIHESEKKLDLAVWKFGFWAFWGFLRCGKSSPTLVSDFVEAAWQNDNLSVGEWLLGPCELRLESGKDRPWTLMNLRRPCSYSTKVGLSDLLDIFKRFLMN